MTEKYHYDTVNGKDVSLYVLKNDVLEVGVSDFGATLRFINYSGKNVTLGHRETEEYLKYNLYFGALVGRVANRTAGGRFVLDGKEYHTPLNDGGVNTLHGGATGFDKKFYEAEITGENEVTLKLISEDGDEGYPGKLMLSVIYRLEENSLVLSMSAASDQDTLWAPTLHTYFNLGGESSGNVSDTILSIHASRYTPSVRNVPTGEVKNVFSTPFDFTCEHAIGDYIEDPVLVPSRGYDHNYVLDGVHAATAWSPKTGIKLDVYTDLPCMQFYTGGFIDHAKGITREYNKLDAFCLEPQYAPNAINMEGFEKPILKKGETKEHTIRYTFTHK